MGYYGPFSFPVFTDVLFIAVGKLRCYQLPSLFLMQLQQKSTTLLDELIPYIERKIKKK